MVYKDVCINSLYCQCIIAIYCEIGVLATPVWSIHLLLTKDSIISLCVGINESNGIWSACHSTCLLGRFFEQIVTWFKARSTCFY